MVATPTLDLTQWLTLLQTLSPLLAAAIPGASVILPTLVDAAVEVNDVADASGPDKKAHVLKVVSDGAILTNATGKVVIPPADALRTAVAIFDAVDGIHAIIKANQSLIPLPVVPLTTTAALVPPASK